MMRTLLLPLLLVVGAESYDELRGRELDDSCANSHGTLEFIVLEGDSNKVAIEDDIRMQLERVGFDVETRLLNKEELNDAHANGDYHLSFYKTYGAPYDPHAYASEWKDEKSGFHAAFAGFEAPASREELFDMIDAVRREEDKKKRAQDWEEIHNYYHQQAAMLGLWGRRVPTIMNRRLTGYQMGNQEFDYPVHKLVPLTGSSTITISPAGQTGMFQSVGRLDPHTYRPNEFFSNNWVYEGLVEYGPHGQILPSLATSWTIADTADGGQQFTFQLRENVQFHDGEPWNCQAAKMNFDHVLAKPLITPPWHGWYGLPEVTTGWTCQGEYEFVVTTNAKYYPYLQELTYIRPLRMLSPAAFLGDSITANSCHEGWGEVTEEVNGEEHTITCAGIANISGTGRFFFSSRDKIVDGEQEYDNEVVFLANQNHWDKVVPTIDAIKIVRYETPEEVKAALLDGSLDVVWGSGILQARDVDELEEVEDLQVFYSGVFQNDILVLNTGKPPLDDITLRKTVIHAIDKKAIADKEFGSSQRPVDNVFPEDAPYCDVLLTPRWDYDIEKALLLGCTPPALEASTKEDGGDGDGDDKTGLAIGLAVGLGSVAAIAIGFAIYFQRQSGQYKTELMQQKKGITA